MPLPWKALFNTTRKKKEKWKEFKVLSHLQIRSFLTLYYIIILAENLQQCFTSCYPILSSEENQEVCHTVLEASFFPGILSLLTIVYRCKNYPDEVTTAKNMCQHVNATPKDLSVRKKYWLLDQVGKGSSYL